jgi:transcriptional regulator GlxA family with amidase domain
VERDLPVVSDRGFITSQGVGTTLLFSLELVRKLTDGARAQTVAKAMLVPYTPLP